MDAVNRLCLVVTVDGGSREGELRGLLTRFHAAGWSVTLLDATAFGGPSTAASSAMASLCAECDAEWVPLPVPDCPKVLTPFGPSYAYPVLQWLREPTFDLIVADLVGAPLHDALNARRMGLAFRGTPMVILAREVSLRARDRAGAFADDPLLLQNDTMEQRQVAWADGLIAAEPDLLAWMDEQGWEHAAPLPDDRLRPGQSLLRGGAAEQKLRDDQPLVSVCLTHFDRPRYLRQAIASLQSQTYPRFEVILVDDGSRTPEAQATLTDLESLFRERGWALIRQDNRYLGAARNRAAREARGEYLLFMDDDNVAYSHELERFVSAATHTGADVLTCWFDLFEGDAPPAEASSRIGRFAAPGGPAICGVFTNCFGDANALVRRDTFERVGGFTEERGVGAEDYELFAKIALQGGRIEVVPEALFQYRKASAGMRLTTSHHRNVSRALRPYLEAVPPAWAPLVRMMPGLYHRLLRDASALAALRSERDVLRARVASMESSASWRFTGWLRRLHAAFTRRP